jgi:hypothetical protein
MGINNSATQPNKFYHVSEALHMSLSDLPVVVSKDLFFLSVGEQFSLYTPTGKCPVV